MIGIGGTVGAIGGMFMAKFTGWVLDATGSYSRCSSSPARAYLIALLVIHLLSPRLEPAQAI